MKQLKESVVERRKLLREYIMACLRDSSLAWSDPLVFDKLLSTFSRDVKFVLVDLGYKASAGLLSVGAMLLSGLAENAKRR